MSIQPLYLSPPRGPVLGFLHQGEKSRDPAILLCAPMGWDDLASYRIRREWAEDLAGGGYPTLRFDWPGSGDSSGSPHDPDLLGAWTDAVAAAATWLRGVTGARQLCAIGMGLGGLLAVRAMALGAPIDELVLWGVPAQGKRVTRELQAFSRLTGASRAGEGEPGQLMQAGGFVFTAETLAAIEGLDAGELEVPAGDGRRALLLGRDGDEVDRRLRSALEQAGMSIDEDQGPGYGSMTSEPQQAVAPCAVWTRVRRWLARGELRPARTVAVALATTICGVREEPLWLDGPSGRLFAILSESVDAPRADSCAILLNAGAIRHIGPNRMWVEMARRWAAQGLPTLRVDLEGLGDADGDGRRFAASSEFHLPELIDQVRCILDLCTERGLSSRFVLGGLCSGAYWSFQTALADERVHIAVLLNPRVLFWHPALHVWRDTYRMRRMVHRAEWRRLRRRAYWRRGMTALGFAVAHAAGRVEGPETQLDEALDRLAARSQRLLFVFGTDEMLRDDLEREGRFELLRARPHVEVELIDCHVHTLSPIPAQRLVHVLVDHALRELLAPPRDGQEAADPAPHSAPA